MKPTDALERCAFPGCPNMADPKWYICDGKKSFPACDGHGGFSLRAEQNWQSRAELAERRLADLLAAARELTAVWDEDEVDVKKTFALENRLRSAIEACEEKTP